MPTLFNVATEEVSRYVRLADRRILIATLVLGLVIGAAWPVVQDRGITPEAGMFSVAIEPDSELAPVVDSDPAFTVVGSPTGEAARTADLVIRGDTVRYDADRDKSVAAADRLERAARAYMDRALVDEADQAAAYPVSVNLIFQQRDLAQAPPGTGQGPQAPDAPDDDGDGGADDGNGTGSNATSELVTGESTQQAGLDPSQVTPPFPMKSLLYTFAYLIPLTFIGELYGGSIFSERVKSRGLLLLSTPISGSRLLLGKSLPYVLVTLGVAGITTVLLGAGLIGFLAALPIIAFALASSLLIGILAPSQRALTFLLVSTNVLLSTFLFLPAIFTEVPPVAFLSPVGLIAAAIRGDPVGVGQLLYGTVPLTLITIALVALAVASFREETMFAPGGATSKLVDGLDHLLSSRRGFVAAGLLAVPIALALELFVLVFAVTLGLTSAFILFLFGSAFVEEALKAAPGYAHASRARGKVTSFAPWVVGSLVGLGFFLGEKGVVGLGILGFGLLPRGSEALATFGVASSPLLILAPLVLHAVTATITATAARGGKAWTVAGWLGASIVHTVYNGTVIFLLSGGGIPW